MNEIERFLAQFVDLSNRQLYKLVWSDDQYEWRTGVFNDYYGSVFLREYSGTRLVPKYPYLAHRWILEKYFPPEIALDPALPLSHEGCYEPLFVFQDKEQEPLPVVLKVVEMIVKFDLNQSRKSNSLRASEDRAAFELTETQEFERILDSIDSTAISSLLHTKEAIVKP